MSRTTLCVLTAGGLVLLSVGLMAGRYWVLGKEVKLPGGPGTWKVTLLVHGKCGAADGKVMTVAPLDFGHQHVLQELGRSSEFQARPRDAKRLDRQLVLWTRRAGIPEGAFRLRYEFYCTVDDQHPSSPMIKQARVLYGAPPPDAFLKSEPGVEADHADVSALARRLTTGLERYRDQCEALYHYVEHEIASDPSVGKAAGTALDCLRNGSGDSAAKSRLLVALCRNRGIPARLVTGITLKKGYEQTAHVWAEAWVAGHWLAMCPFYRHFGRVPPTYLVLQFGDEPLVRGRNVRELRSAFLVERSAPDDALTEDTSRLKRLLTRLSLFALPPAERHLVEFLLLLPIAALIVCLFRNVIGLNSFGTFAPALVGLAFREVASLPGILVFVSIVLIGWLMRRLLDRYHLLQVPRIAFLLSLVVIVLIGTTVAANYHDLPVTRYFSLFPMVILTGMIERFWTLEVEDGTASSFRTLLGTIVIAATISLVLSMPAVVRHMFRYPETLGLIMAAQLLLGRYTGYRLSELLRFRDFVKQPAAG
jgi:7 transmembrane helices usually fused to an inactive transglutaminase/Transglutaminase-like superfamily